MARREVDAVVSVYETISFVTLLYLENAWSGAMLERPQVATAESEKQKCDLMS